jgi:hypothetical protein
MVVTVEYMNCRRNIIDNAGNWTVEKMCDDCQSDLFIQMMISTECGRVKNAKSIIQRTLTKLD